MASHRQSSDLCRVGSAALTQAASWESWALVSTTSSCSQSVMPHCTHCWCCRTWMAWCWSVASSYLPHLYRRTLTGVQVNFIITGVQVNFTKSWTDTAKCEKLYTHTERRQLQHQCSCSLRQHSLFIHTCTPTLLSLIHISEPTRR